MTREQIEAEFDKFSSTLPKDYPWTCVDFAQHIATLAVQEHIDKINSQYVQRC